jgi:uncharacterized protein YbjT (DUF2867 family)
MNDRLILVTGATGKQGGAVARELLRKGYKVRAMTRNVDGDAAKAIAKLGGEVVFGDLDNEATLEKAVRGAWGVFAVQNTWEAGVEKEEIQGIRLAEVAKKADLSHYVYTSVGSAQLNTGIPHFDNKWRIEEKVRSLNFPTHVIIRPVFFMDNFASPMMKPAIDTGKLVFGLKPTTPLQMIAVKDIGLYGLMAFEKYNELNGQEIDIAGDSLQLPDAASIIGNAAGRTIEYIQQPIEEIRSFSEDYALMVEWFEKVGYSVDIQSNFKKYGIKPTTLSDWADGVKW